MEEYSAYNREDLLSSLRKISKRLGGDKTRDAIDAIERGDFAKAIEIVLFYYDKAYIFGLKKKTIIILFMSIPILTILNPMH